MLDNGLYIIATPIGNLKDISLRALEILQEAEIIACEDTRVTKKLFSLLNISLHKNFITYEDYSEEKQAQKIINLINTGQAVALVSDAGSPLISDPGYKLVRKCREQGIKVSALPGACAVITALQMSGLPTNRFMFGGFIPNKEKARRELFAEFSSLNTTLVFYETAPRLQKTLSVAAEIFAGREVSVMRELTKMYEETIWGTFDDVINYFTEYEPRGEFVIVIGPPNETKNITENVRQILAERMQETSLKTAVKEITERFGLNKNEVYAMALELKNE